jgi:CMP/dCMP kinase
MTDRSDAGGARRLVIAIDGPAGSGKSTAARALAEALGYVHIESGAMYRMVALAALERGIAPDDGAALTALVPTLDLGLEPHPGGQRARLDGRDVTEAIRTEAVSAAASRVATHPGVRTQLVQRQRQLAQAGGVVMDGRDIGTVVLPDADCKFFVDAAPAERARRRARDLVTSGAATDVETTARELEARDARDRQRAHSPLSAAPDATHVDTTSLGPDEVLRRMLEAARARARA